MDIYKGRKKKRKQEKKNERRDGGGGNSISTGEKGSGCRGDTKTDNDEEQRINEPPPGFNGVRANANIKGKENGNYSSPEFGAENVKGQRRKKKGTQPDGSGVTNGDGPLPQQSSSHMQSKLPASGQHQSQSSTQIHPQAPSTPDPSRLSLDDSQETSSPKPPQPESTHEVPSLLPSQTLLVDPPPSDALFIIVPRNERPDSLPGQPESSLAVPAARHFISKYYSHFDGSLPINDLIRYYTNKAQKSVSIGGAHSVVTGRRDIEAQILSLAGASFVVRGVVAQDAADGKGVMILVTGTAVTALNGSAGGVVASFAHSISLVPIDDGILREIKRYNQHDSTGEGICSALLEAVYLGYPFQIHNDALALLSGDTGPVNPNPTVPQPTQIQQPTPPMQKPPPPPPGLF